MIRSTVRGALAAWERLFYGKADVDGRVLALLRSGFAALVLVHVVALFPYAGMLWSEEGVLPLSELRAIAQGRPPTLLAALRAWDLAPYVAFALLGVHALLLLVGYRTRLQAVMVLVWLASFQNRNPLVTNGQDALLRIITFFMVLLPLGSAWSLDARRLGERRVTSERLWPLRLLELQVSFVMLAAGLWKALGTDWTDGTALYYVTKLEGFWGNFPVTTALTESPRALALMTYLTLGLELSLPVAIWVPALRRASLVLALGFHLALAYAMNLFLFPWIMILGWCAFLRASDLELVARVVSRSSARGAPSPRLSLQRIRP